MLRRCFLLSRTVVSYQNTINLCNNIFPVNRFQFRDLNVSAQLLKTKKNLKSKASKEESDNIDKDNTILVETKEEMESCKKILIDELSKHFSNQVDLRVYEDILVELDDGSCRRMNHLGRVSCKSAHMVMINFSDNPSTIKNAKIALQKSSLNVNPQQEGVVLYVQIPRMTKERRKELANAAKTKTFNDYKQALNDIYVKADKKSLKEAKSIDIAKSNRTALLAIKKAMEKKGMDLVEAKQKDLLSEIM